MQVLTKDIEIEVLKVKLRHLLQYINTTQTFGNLYSYPTDRKMTAFIVYSDASFAHSGKHSQSGYTIHLSIMSFTAKISESSAEAELYALANASCLQLSASHSRVLYLFDGHVFTMRQHRCHRND